MSTPTGIVAAMPAPHPEVLVRLRDLYERHRAEIDAKLHGTVIGYLFVDRSAYREDIMVSVFDEEEIALVKAVWRHGTENDPAPGRVCVIGSCC